MLTKSHGGSHSVHSDFCIEQWATVIWTHFDTRNFVKNIVAQAKTIQMTVVPQPTPLSRP